MTDSDQRANRRAGWSDEEDGDGQETFKVLSAQEAQALRLKYPPLSPWRLVQWQAGMGGLVTVMAWLLTQQWMVAVSALWGAVAVVVPSALMAWGVGRRSTWATPGSLAVRFTSFEFLKILASVLLLVLAPKLLQTLSWPALLASLVLCLKVYWVALLWRRRTKRS